MTNSSSSGETRAAGLRTFLIADVRGYTTYTREHGDERGAQLAADFAAAVREVVAPFDGNLLELRGDEALVVFESPRQALRAAIALQEKFQEIGLPRGVGIGLDAGEAIAVEGGYRGGALNLAARLCAQAAAGEILASEAVVHLAARMEGIEYAETRSFRLKGYAKPIRAVEVAVPANARTAMSRRIRRIRGAIALHPRVLGAVAAAAVLAAGALAILLRPPAQPGPKPEPTLADVSPGIALVDSGTGKEAAHVELSRVSQPVDVTYAAGFFWVLNLEPLSFIQLDPSNGSIVRQLAIPFEEPGGFAADDRSFWIADYDHPVIARIDIGSGREVDRFDLSKTIEPDDIGFSSLAVGDGSLWAAGRERGQVFRINPGNGKVLARIDDAGSFSAGFGEGMLWTGSDFGFLRVDPTTNEAIQTDVPLGHLAGNIATGGGFAWTADESKGVVYKIDRAGKVAATIATGIGAHGVFFSDGTVWVANQDVGTVSAIDAVTGNVKDLVFGHPVTSVAAGAGKLLVTLDRGRSYEDRIDALTGSVARLFTAGYQFGSGEHAIEWNPEAFLIGDATCSSLVAWVRGADATWRLEPEVAAAMPTISADGRTYTFQIRPGFAFSDASAEPVTAQTFRYSIERALSPRLGDGAPGTLFVDDILGEDAFRSGEAQHISGLVAEGDRLTITLVEPRGDLVSRLALPFFCPVRANTPLVSGGAVNHVTGANGITDSIDSAGPYYVADWINGEYVILKKNPNYAGQRAGAFDAIALREGLSGGVAVDGVNSGEWDGVIDIEDQIFGLHGELASQWGPDSDNAAKGDRRFYLVPDGGIWMAWLNASGPPFSDPRLRRAAALAINRAAAADAGTSANVQLLPWSRFLGPPMLTTPPPTDDQLQPNLALARALIGKTAPPPIRLGVPSFCNECLGAAERIARDLESVGFQVEVARVRESDDPERDFDMHMTALFPDTPDRAAFVGQLLGIAHPEGWLPAALDGADRPLASLTGDARERRVTRLEEEITRQVPALVFAYSAKGAYFGPTISCVGFTPIGLLDITGLCPPS